MEHVFSRCSNVGWGAFWRPHVERHSVPRPTINQPLERLIGAVFRCGWASLSEALSVHPCGPLQFNQTCFGRLCETFPSLRVIFRQKHGKASLRMKERSYESHFRDRIAKMTIFPVFPDESSSKGLRDVATRDLLGFSFRKESRKIQSDDEKVLAAFPFSWSNRKHVDIWASVRDVSSSRGRCPPQCMRLFSL